MKTTMGNPGKKNKGNWKEVSIGGVTGILLGGAGAFGAYAMTNKEDGAEVSTDTATVPHIEGAPVMATGVNDNMSFSEAFEAARAEVGAGGTFEWHGSVYGTYTSDEWNALTPAQRDDFYAQATGDAESQAAEAPTEAHHHEHHHHHHHHDEAQETRHETTQSHAGSTATTGSTATGTTHTEEEGPVAGTTTTTTTTGGEVTTGGDGGEDGPEWEFLGVEQVDLAGNGNMSNVGVASYGGQTVLYIDVDGQDDEFEYAVSDLNQNGQFDEDEFVDISDQHIHVSDFQAASEMQQSDNNVIEDYTAENRDLPDYVNDADPVDLA